ncbi:hypothetical protein PAXRUDRAFT_821275 [Paxillus rubicundulus Ve08.2h10]|uniref:GST N-terminal domain-containing protein n=1 Tax=Paxillus rubicundulus Ve08.2h10 TaxID=930991 RepID=A0A0D0DP70_9AGAM|nr:hypothetical protein PAXRUDRAFT_821275 [Paxillus rubicundulus Ve08.2h10]
MLPLVLYDTPSKLPGNNWSPNPAKTRFVLGYKNLPFETVWVEFPDIATKMKEIGASQNKGSDGSDIYTVPVLSDPNTGALITDSWVISEYLDKTYPEKPIFPHNSNGLINAFSAAFSGLSRPAYKFIVLRGSQILNEPSMEYYIRTRQEFFKENIDEFSPEGPKRDAHWEIIEKSSGAMKTWYDKSSGKWLMGDTFSYADILIASGLFCFKRILHEEEWKRICSWNDGKWEKMLEDVEKECNLV